MFDHAAHSEASRTRRDYGTVYELLVNLWVKREYVAFGSAGWRIVLCEDSLLKTQNWRKPASVKAVMLAGNRFCVLILIFLKENNPSLKDHDFQVRGTSVMNGAEGTPPTWRLCREQVKGRGVKDHAPSSAHHLIILLYAVTLMLAILSFHFSSIYTRCDIYWGVPSITAFASRLVVNVVLRTVYPFTHGVILRRNVTVWLML